MRRLLRAEAPQRKRQICKCLSFNLISSLPFARIYIWMQYVWCNMYILCDTDAYIDIVGKRLKRRGLFGAYISGANKLFGYVTWLFHLCDFVGDVWRVCWFQFKSINAVKCITATVWAYKIGGDGMNIWVCDALNLIDWKWWKA